MEHYYEVGISDSVVLVSNTNKEVLIFLSVMQETLSGCSYMKYGVDADS